MHGAARRTTASVRLRSVVPAALLALLVACGGGGDDEPVVADGTTSPSPSASSAAPASPALSATPAPEPPPPVPAPEPPPPPPSPVLACAGTDAEALPAAGRAIAITVDLGGDATGLPPILQTLEAEDVRATFFVTGAWLRRHPDGLRQIAAAGHVVGNHTDTHPRLPTLSAAQVRAELAAVEDLVRATTGRTTRPLFRFPFGERDARTLAVVNTAGYCAYRWTVDTLGWKGTSGGVTAPQVVDRVLSTLRPGQIVLMHGGANPDDGSTLDADALPEVLGQVRARGYGFTTLPTR